MIKIAVCDDDMNFLLTTMKYLLARAIKSADIQAKVTFFNNEKKLLHEFEMSNIYDIVILDIDMPLINGKELAQKLRDIDSEFCLAFMSAYREEVFVTIPLGISAFIPKDFDRDACLSALVKLFKDYSKKQPDNTFWEIIDDGLTVTRRISLNNIFYIQCNNGNIVLHTHLDSFILTERVFEKITQKLISQGFYRSHRNYIVNVSKIYEVLDKEIVMSNEEHLPISKRNRKGLFKEMAGVVSEKVGK